MCGVTTHSEVDLQELFLRPDELGYHQECRLLARVDGILGWVELRCAEGQLLPGWWCSESLCQFPVDVRQVNLMLPLFFTSSIGRLWRWLVRDWVSSSPIDLT